MEQQNMDFNVSEATRFLEYYKKKKAITKAGFLEELIKTNNNFNGKSIFDKKLLLENYYSKCHRFGLKRLRLYFRLF